MTEIQETIRRLLALSKSSNEFEAALAASKAAQLMAKHNLTKDIFEVKRTANQVTHKTYPVPPDNWEWVPILANELGKVLFCRVIRKPSMGILDIVGREDDIEAVFQVLTWIMFQISQLSIKVQIPPRQNRKKYLDDWCIGCASRVGVRMRQGREEEEKALPGAYAIVKVMDEQVDQKVKELYPNLSISRGRNLGSGYEKGWKDGEKIKIRDETSSPSLGGGYKKLK